MGLPMHAAYEHLVEQARWSHENGRSAENITQEDVDLARLYAYAFRIHTIGAFHATRERIEQRPDANPLAMAHRRRAIETLEDLANQGMEQVGSDYRTLIGVFYRYDRSIRRAIDAMQCDYQASRDTTIADIGERFTQLMSEITVSNSIHLTRDDAAPEQANFIVPNLGITIVPLVYGDHHSWNLAYLKEGASDVPCHRHQSGVEIHLGYAPLKGNTILGNCQAPIDESYAMPIPPMTRHGYVNTSDMVHHVPFIFGSLKQAGWGVFLDVEPQPAELDQLQATTVEGWQMGGTVFLERQINSVAAMSGSRRHVMIPASVTDRNGSGGLELAVWRINKSGQSLPIDDFRAVGVVRGSGVVRLGQVEQVVQSHEHFGIPAGMSASIAQQDDEPLVILDATIKHA